MCTWSVGEGGVAEWLGGWGPGVGWGAGVGRRRGRPGQRVRGGRPRTGWGSLGRDSAMGEACVRSEPARHPASDAAASMVCDCSARARCPNSPVTTCGAIAIQAPEHFAGGAPLEGARSAAAADVWACGVMLYAMPCGHYPFVPLSERAGECGQFKRNPRTRVYTCPGSRSNGWRCATALHLAAAALDTHRACQVERTGARVKSPTPHLHTRSHLPAAGRLDAPQAPAFPDSLPPACRDLASRMLEPDPKRRITVAGIMAHPWFKAGLPFDAAELNARVMRTPQPSWAPGADEIREAARRAAAPPAARGPAGPPPGGADETVGES